MFDRFENQTKADQFMFERTAAPFSDTQEDSFVHQIEAEKGYVSRLKVQREKIQNLYSRYDVLLNDLKSKEVQIKQKDKTISTLQAKCKNLNSVSQESSLFKQQNHHIKTQNQTLQKAIAQLQQSYTVLHGQYRSKEVVTSQKYEQMEHLNDQLMSKLRSLSIKYQEREEEFGYTYKELSQRFEEFKLQVKKQRENHLQEIQVLQSANMQKDEENKVLKAQTQCLKQRLIELESYINQATFQNQEKLQHIQKERKCQVRALKSEIEHMKELNCALQRKWSKLKDQFQVKEISLHEMTMIADQHQKQNAQALQVLKYQHNQEKTALKEQLVHFQNHIAKLERKMAEMVRKEQALYGKIKKYEVTFDAKRNLREIEKEEIQKINLLLKLH